MSAQMKRILGISALLIAVDICISMVVLRDIRKQNAQYLSSLAEASILEQDRTFFKLSRQMLSILLGSEGTKSEINRELAVLESSRDPLEINVARAGLKENFVEYTWDYGTNYRFFVFLEKSDRYVDLSSLADSVPEMEQRVRELLKEGNLDTSSAKAQWTSVELVSGSYILKIMHNNGRYLGCFTRTEALLAPFEGLGAQGRGHVMLAEPDRQLQENPWKYLIIEKYFTRAPFKVILFIDNMGIYEKYLAIHVALILLGAAILASLTFILQYVQRRLYANELNRQRIQMDYLQLQIKPHFYLNCLNFIYQMIELECYEDAKRMAAVTSDYLRYLFQSSMDFVEISSELEHVKNYLEIQKMRYHSAFTYYIEQDSETAQDRIVPLMIQTYVENSVKHTVSLDHPVEISILVCAERIGGERAVHITISDTGNGFPGEVLRQLTENGELAQLEGGHRIGITNCLKRMRYFYGERGSIEFYNNPKGGAVVDMYLPV